MRPTYLPLAISSRRSAMSRARGAAMLSVSCGVLVLGCATTTPSARTREVSVMAESAETRDAPSPDEERSPQWHECRIETVRPERVAGPVTERDTQARVDALCADARARRLECPSAELMIVSSGAPHESQFALHAMNRSEYVGESDSLLVSACSDALRRLDGGEAGPEARISRVDGILWSSVPAMIGRRRSDLREALSRQSAANEARTHARCELTGNFRMVAWEASVPVERLPSVSAQLQVGARRQEAPCWTEAPPSSADTSRMSDYRQDEDGGATAHCVLFGPARGFDTTGFGATKLEACEQAFERACGDDDCLLQLSEIDTVPLERLGFRVDG